MAHSNGMVQATIPYFDGKGYTKWRFKMKVFLESHDLLKVVTKVIPKAEQNTSRWESPQEFRVDVGEGNVHVPEIKAVDLKKEAKALYFIHQSVSNSVFMKIERAKTAAEAWKIIKDKYKPLGRKSVEELDAKTTRQRIPGPIPEDEEDRGRYLNYCGDMCHAAMNGDWKWAEDLISKFPQILKTRISYREDTALHVAVYGHQKSFIRKLVERMEADDLLIQNKITFTALTIAAGVGDTEIAKLMVDKNRRALMIPSAGGLWMPVHWAAFHGCRKMLLYLYQETDLEELIRDQRVHLFHVLIDSENYDKALEMLRKDRTLAFSRVFDRGPLHSLARKTSAISGERHLGFFKKLIHSCCGRMFNKAWMQTMAHQLVEELWRAVLQDQYYKMIPLNHEHIRLLRDAARIGNVEFIVILFHSYPGLVGQLDSDHQTLFHVAAMNRQENVFNLVSEFGFLKKFITLYSDRTTTGNTMLHSVASLPPPAQLQNVSGPALEMQRELLWFEAVQKIMPELNVELKNHEGERAREIFTRQHKQLQTEGEKWMKDTASSCMLVAVLVATVAFAAAFTVPGGNDQNIGIPLLRENHTAHGIPFTKTRTWFNIFAASDAVALCTSVLSGAFFLSILTSRYAEEDFRRSLPLKLTFGLLVLAISIAAMLLAFSASFFLSYCKYKRSWIPYFIISLAAGTAFLYGLMHVRLLFSTLKATLRSSILFRPWRRRVYHRRLPFPLSWVSEQWAKILD